jgi:nucleotide-binding universal stress UspA family protein
LVAIDFSAASRRALDVARAMSLRLDAEVVLLHVDAAPETAPLSARAAARRAHARVEMEKLRRELEEAAVPVRVLLRPGDPAREILRVAEDQASIVIVMGRQGASRAATTLLGSVTDRVMRYARQPVLVVPDPTLAAPSFDFGSVEPLTKTAQPGLRHRSMRSPRDPAPPPPPPR